MPPMHGATFRRRSASLAIICAPCPHQSGAALQAYDHKFYRDLGDTALPSARRIVPYIMELCPVTSVVDLGCGDGSWLAVFSDHGVGAIQGFDGPFIAADQLRIPADRFQRVALDAPIPVPRRFDLAMSLEVAEHLPPARAAGFVADLCAAAPVVLFSAAIPRQGGLNHLNEQWPAYWAAQFAQHGFRPIDALRSRFWDDASVTWWYRQNLLLFASDQGLALWPRLAEAAARCSGPVPALIHPELYARLAKLSDPGFGRWIRMGWRALRRSLGRH